LAVAERLHALAEVLAAVQDHVDPPERRSGLLEAVAVVVYGDLDV